MLNAKQKSVTQQKVHYSEANVTLGRRTILTSDLCVFSRPGLVGGLRPDRTYVCGVVEQCVCRLVSLPEAWGRLQPETLSCQTAFPGGAGRHRYRTPAVPERDEMFGFQPISWKPHFLCLGVHTHTLPAVYSDNLCFHRCVQRSV